MGSISVYIPKLSEFCSHRNAPKEEYDRCFFCGTIFFYIPLLLTVSRCIFSESSKDVLISIFGPKMTLYRCGGCESTFVFRSVFSDHLYRGVVPYRLRCAHCKDTLAFTNVCQVKEHVRSHGYTAFQSAKGFVLTVAEVNDENLQPGDSLGAKLAANQLARTAGPSSSSQAFGMKSMAASKPATVAAPPAPPAPPPTSSNKMLQEMLRRTDEVPPMDAAVVSRPPPLSSTVTRPVEMHSYRHSSVPVSTPTRNSAAHALQRLRLQVGGRNK